MNPSLRSTLAAWLLFAGLFLLFASQTRVLSAGYSFSDEYELLTVSQNLQHRSVLEEYWIRQKAESVARFRPVACLVRTAEISLVREHVRVHRAWRIALGVVTAFLFYAFARRLGWTFFESILLSILTLFGKQVWTWWLPSTQEGLGIFFVACAWMGLAFHEPSSKRRWPDALFVFGCVMASLSKESYIVVLPGLVFFRVWLLKERHGWTWGESLRQNAGIGLLVGLVCLAQILFIVYVAPGAQGPGYAGFKGILPDAFGRAFLELGRYGNGGVLGILLLAAAASAVWKPNRKLAAPVAPLIFWFLMAVPSVLLHQVSGFTGAYCLPGVLGFSYSILYLYRVLLAQKALWMRAVFLILLAGSMIPNLRLAFDEASRYAAECEGIERTLDEVEAHSAPSEPILIAANPARHIEWGAAIKIFLELDRGRANVFYYPVDKLRYTDFERSMFSNPRSLYNVYQNRIVSARDLNRFNVIVVLPTMEFFFLLQSRSEFLKNEYRRVESGGFTLYIKKDTPFQKVSTP